MNNCNLIIKRRWYSKSLHKPLHQISFRSATRLQPNQISNGLSSLFRLLLHTKSKVYAQWPEKLFRDLFFFLSTLMLRKSVGLLTFIRLKGKVVNDFTVDAKLELLSPLYLLTRDQLLYEPSGARQQRAECTEVKSRVAENSIIPGSESGSAGWQAFDFPSAVAARQEEITSRYFISCMFHFRK